MKIHSTEKIKDLKRLRRMGYSINELVERLHIPKTTAWHYARNVKVLSKYKSILKSKRGGSKKRKELNWQKAQSYAGELLRSQYRELAIMVAMLYWGEGSKKRCEFINSEGRIIQLYLLGLRRIFNVPEKDIKSVLRIFSGMNKIECLNYWSRITKIPSKNFTVRLNDGGTRGRTKYGMCRIIIKKGGSYLKLIKSLIDQSFKEANEKY
ncbi:MAG: hypothetical protein ABH800_00750 [Candidatus Nealsonbacteria bacterium]